MFFQSDHQFLQREEPLIHILQPQLEKFLKNVYILGKFVKPTVLAECLKQPDGLLSVDYNDAINQVTKLMVIWYLMKQTVQSLQREEGISPHK